MSEVSNSQSKSGFAWYALIVGILVGVVGLILAAGGIWLLLLGGSWYYAITGLLMIVSGILLFRRQRSGAYLFVAIWLGTLIWAIWEVTLDGWEPASDWWALEPRVFPPTVMLALVLIALPGMGYRAGRTAAFIATAALGLSLGMGAAPPLHAQQDTTQAAPGAEPTAPAATETQTQAQTETTLVPTETVQSTQSDKPTDRPAPAARLKTGKDWPVYGGTVHAERYSPLAQINTDNVGNLQEAWSMHTGDMPSKAADGKYSPENTPLKVGDSLFVCTPMDQVLALDASTGREEWRHDPGVSEDAIPYGATCRGLAYHAQADVDPDMLCAARILVGTLDARLIALDAQTGQVCPDFGQQGIVDLNNGIGETVPGWYAVTAPPTIVRGVAVIGAQVKDNEANDAPSGVVRGYDVITGEMLWAWDLGQGGAVDEPAEGDVYTRGTPNMWTMASADQDLGYVYLPLGNSSSDYYGSDRSAAENEFSSSLVALDATTGRRGLAFPDRAPRCLGLRSGQSGDFGGLSAKRPKRARADPAVETGADLCAEPGNRRKPVPGRGTRGYEAGQRRAGLYLGHTALFGLCKSDQAKSDGTGHVGLQPD